MIWNLTIAAISTGIIGFNVMAFKFKKSKLKICLMLFGSPFLILWFATIFVPNISFILSPLASKVNGKIVDVDTGKPLPNTYVRIAWVRHEATVGGGGRPAYKVYNTTTNEHGEFIIPWALKTLSIYIPMFFISEYGGIDVFAYSLDYQGSRTVAEGDVKLETIDLSMHPIKNESEYLKNLENIQEIFYSYRLGENVTTEEKDLLINAHRNFDKKYPNGSMWEINLLKLGGLLERTGNIEEAINVSREMLRRNPSRENAEYAQYEINYYEKYLHNKRSKQ